MLEIISNGSKMAGQPPDNINSLITALNRHRVDPSLFGAYTMCLPGVKTTSGRWTLRPWKTVFQGNFSDVSHVFYLRTDDPALIATLTDACLLNVGLFTSGD